MAPLLQQLASSVPTEFRLPEEIRTHFKDGIDPSCHLFSLLTVVLSRYEREGSIYGCFQDQTSPFEVRNHSVLLQFILRSDFDSRHGQLEDRDPHRLKDRNGDPILCFRCGFSALPHYNTPIQLKRPRKVSQRLANTEGWKSIVSCDYCDLSWHLDCLDPPLDSMPLFGVKWMCPNHADRVYVRSHSPCSRCLQD